MSRPSRSRLMPTSTSNLPRRRSRMISDALHRLHVRVQVTHLHAVLVQVLGEILGHALGQRGDQHALVLLGAQLDLGEHVVHLRGHGPHFHHRVHEVRRPQQLLHRLRRMRALRTGPASRDTKIICGASCSHSSNFSGRLSSARRQAEAVLHQRLLARAVALVHGAELRNGLVRSRRPPAARSPAGSRTGTVAARPARGPRDSASSFRCRSSSRPLSSSPCRTCVRCSRRCASTSLFWSRSTLSRSRSSSRMRSMAPISALLRRHVVRARIHRVARHLALDLAGQRIEQRDGLDGFIEQLDAHRFARGLRREDVDDVTAHAVRARLQVQLVARVLHVREPAQQAALVHALAAVQVQDHRVVRRRDRPGRR